MSRAWSVSDTARAEKLVALGCIACLMSNGMETPPAIHHIDGKTKPGCHKKTIPLCERHHQTKDNVKPRRWTSLHGDGRAAFTEVFGSEQYLLEETNRMIGA